MDEMSIVRVLEALGSRRIKRGNGKVTASCPFAPYLHKGEDKNPSFSMEVNGSGPSRFYCFACFKLDAPILTPNGIVPIGGLKVGDEVVTHNGNVQKITQVFEKTWGGDFVRIKVRKLGEDVVCTADHKVFVRKKASVVYGRAAQGSLMVKGDVEEVQAKDLAPGDWVCLPRMKETEAAPQRIPVRWAKYRKVKGPEQFDPMDDRVDEDLAWLLGIYTAEGSFNRGPMFSLHIKEDHLADRILRILWDKFEMKGSRYFTESQNRQAVWVGNAMFGKFLDDQCGHLAHNKKVPEFIMRGSDAVRAAFLKGYWDGDGHASSNIMRVTTVSHTLAYQVRVILNSLGHTPSLYIKDAYVNPTDGQAHRTSYVLSWSKENRRNLFSFLDDGHVWHQVASVDIFRDGDSVLVRDIEVAGDHSYVAFGIGVHNCKAGGKKAISLLYKWKECTGEWKSDLHEMITNQEGGSIFERVKRLGDFRGSKKKALPHIEASAPWMVDNYEANFEVEEFAEVLKFLPRYAFQRGITADQAKKWGLGYDQDFQRLFFSVIDENGKFVGYSKRAILEDQEPKYLHAQYFRRDKYLYGEQFIDHTVRVGYLMEGFMDVLNLDRLGWVNVLACFGTAVSDAHIEKLKRWFDRVVILPHNDAKPEKEDEDPPGLKMAKDYGRALRDAGVEVIIGPMIKGKKDPGDWSPADAEVVKQRIERFVNGQASAKEAPPKTTP